MEIFINTIELSFGTKLALKTKEFLQALQHDSQPKYFVLQNRDGQVQPLESIKGNEKDILICKKSKGIVNEDPFSIFSIEFIKSIKEININDYVTNEAKTAICMSRPTLASRMTLFASQKNSRTQRIDERIEHSLNQMPKESPFTSTPFYHLAKDKSQNFSVLLQTLKSNQKAETMLNDPVVFTAVFKKLREFSESSNLKDKIFDARSQYVKQELKDIYELTRILNRYVRSEDQQSFVEKSTKRYKMLITIRGKLKRRL